jgi:hypothetical protein
MPLDQKTLILHWNGTRWSRVPSPNRSPVSNELTGVYAIAADDVWAVGTYLQPVNHGSINKTLTEHWNGKKWSVVASPNIAGFDSVLEDVSADASGKDIWAVGVADDLATGSFRTLSMEWTVLGWALRNTRGPSGELEGVRVASRQDVWAVGASSADTLILHRGAKWQRQRSPDPCDINGLDATAGIASSNAWAVGTCETAGVRDTLVTHWNGSAWVHVKSPSPGAKFNSLVGVSALARNDAWAVGSSSDVTVGGDTTLAVHWNGRKWRTVSTPNPDVLNDLLDVAAVTTDDVWAVGYTGDGTGVFKTLLLHWNGRKWVG